MGKVRQTRPHRPIRVLYLIYWLESGGVESWLRRITSRRPRELQIVLASYHINDYFASYYSEHGCTICRVPRATSLFRYLGVIYQQCRSLRPHVVHSNNYHGGFELLAAKFAGVPVRIAHSHNVAQAHDDHNLAVRIALRISRMLIQRYATHGLACSEQAAQGMFGKHWRSDPRWQVLHNGIELTEFRKRWNRFEICREFGLPAHAVVIGHVGRLSQEKNHGFVVDLAPGIVECIPQAYFVFVGDGEARSQLEHTIRRSGLIKRFRLPGIRSDVPRLMTSLFDVLILPSKYEGLPYVVIEAQAAGIPVVASEATPQEAVVIPELVTRLPLSAPKELWVEAIDQAVRMRPRVSADECLAAIERSDFNVEVSASRLFALYENALGIAHGSIGGPRRRNGRENHH